ncbi:nitroreductase [Spongiibacter taiwanensis]|uniref:nitroreductase family protein n=1 Tax=Spongiibacter taiwanensis TaxID=1748242 RepID=UPI0020355387|nr:nitroreductase [Spongiibacter taiwanensis]USA42895.1 nitroreductase [Spongiibacter taiwanensis]
MNAIELLLQRNSAPKLCDPAPSDAQLQTMFAAACRAPDHAWLRPYRFLVVNGDARHKLGELFAAAALRRQPGLDDAALEKFRRQPLRAPVVIVVYAQVVPHDKVPAIEQKLTVGCAAQGILLAAEAMGFAGIWRTGDNAYDEMVKGGLGLAATEEIIGFLYLGTREGGRKLLPEIKTTHFVKHWGTGE